MSTSSKLSHSVFARDFSATVRKALLKKGVAVLGLCVIPDMSSSMPFANGSRGYQVSDNGTGRVLSYSEVIATAA